MKLYSFLSFTVLVLFFHGDISLHQREREGQREICYLLGMDTLESFPSISESFQDFWHTHTHTHLAYLSNYYGLESNDSPPNGTWCPVDQSQLYGVWFPVHHGTGPHSVTSYVYLQIVSFTHGCVGISYSFPSVWRKLSITFLILICIDSMWPRKTLYRIISFDFVEVHSVIQDLVSLALRSVGYLKDVVK